MPSEIGNKLSRQVAAVAWIWPGVIAISALGLVSAAEYTAAERAARREQVEQLSPADRQKLVRLQHRFESLTAAEQDRLRDLDRALNSDPHGERLRKELDAYYGWLKTLTHTQRSDLLELPPDQRLAKIAELRGEQARAALFDSPIPKPLTREDMRPMMDWIRDIGQRNLAAIEAKMPDDVRVDWRKKPPEQRRYLWPTWQWMSEEAPVVESDDIQKLAERLSDDARAALLGATPAQQQQLVRTWVGACVRWRFDRWRTGGAVVQQEMERFLASLAPSRLYDSLMAMPRDQMQSALRTQYWAHVRERGTHRGRGRNRGGANRAPEKSSTEQKPTPQD